MALMGAAEPAAEPEPQRHMLLEADGDDEHREGEPQPKRRKTGADPPPQEAAPLARAHLQGAAAAAAAAAGGELAAAEDEGDFERPGEASDGRENPPSSDTGDEDDKAAGQANKVRRSIAPSCVASEVGLTHRCLGPG